MEKKQLVLIQLNELNFEIVDKYIEKYNGRFKNFEAINKLGVKKTKSEKNYNDLEPWIQWYSVYTGKTLDEHKIFRLGDSVNDHRKLIYDEIESLGYKIGAVAPMNAKNNLLDASYFISDPWTNTTNSGSSFIRKVASILSKVVNDNSTGKIGLVSLIILFAASLRYARLTNYRRYIKLVVTSKLKIWRKAIFLDLLLHDIHLKLLKKHKPNFTSIFLNAGAHIQHHYFLSCEAIDNPKHKNPAWYINPKHDPMLDIIDIYDKILGDYIYSKTFDFIVATGLSQTPSQQPSFYYRLRDHSSFLKKIEVNFTEVMPRMTRDFLIKFKDNKSRDEAKSILSKLTEEQTQVPIFGMIEERENELFVTSDFDIEIKDTTEMTNQNGKKQKMKDDFVFVAIKNGIHNQKGYVVHSLGVKSHQLDNGFHVCKIHDLILSHFGTEIEAGQKK